MTSRTRFRNLLPLLLVMASGCDSDDDGDGDENLRPGTYTATVSGHVSGTLSGTAVFTGAATQWGLVLGLGQADGVTFLATGKERPGPGTYGIRRYTLEGGPLRVDEFAVSLVVDGVSYTGIEGTLTINDSTPNRMRGSFSLKADRFVGQILDVQGSFDASNPSGM